MKQSVAIPTEVHRRASGHLLRSDGQEDLCFALWNPSRGSIRETSCINELILPQEGERRVHGNVSFYPQYLERALSVARAKKTGLALMHSHHAPGWQDMSPDDVKAEANLAPTVFAATGLPFLGMTLGNDESWSARTWVRIRERTYNRAWSESVRVVGDRLTVTFDQLQRPIPGFNEELTRTVSAWGDQAQANLMRLRVGVVGVGSVGAIVAEALARMGVAHLRLFDFDRVERVNLDRLLHATRKDAERRRLKVEVAAERLRESATAEEFHVDALSHSVVEESGFRAALDCDVLFSCVDRPWPRFVLNAIAYSHLIPVIDGGLSLARGPHGDGLKRATWRAHVVGPTRRCLECLGQYDPGQVSLEASGQLDDPSYIEGLSQDHALRQNQNVFGFSLSVAALEVEQFMRIVIPHPGHANIGAITSHFVPGRIEREHTDCKNGCPFNAAIAKADRSLFSEITGRHLAAEISRSYGEYSSL